MIRDETLDYRSSLAELSALLRREADVLQSVHRLLVTGADRSQCTAMLASISSLELHRAITTREFALECGLAGDLTLSQVMESSPPAWRTLLGEQGQDLALLAAVVQRLLRQRAVTDQGAGNVIVVDFAASPLLQRSLVDFLV